MDAETIYRSLESAGKDIVHEVCQSSGLSPEVLAKNAGCEVKRVRGFLEDDECYLTGKEWERLITYCVLPEMWVYRAKVPLNNDGVIAVAGGGGLPPGKPMDNKIRAVLSTVTWFYREATRRMLAKGETQC